MRCGQPLQSSLELCSLPFIGSDFQVLWLGAWIHATYSFPFCLVWQKPLQVFPEAAIATDFGVGHYLSAIFIKLSPQSNETGADILDLLHICDTLPILSALYLWPRSTSKLAQRSQLTSGRKCSPFQLSHTTFHLFSKIDLGCHII